MSVSYHCPHLLPPHPPFPPSYPSSSSSLFPLSHLYFCEECDAIRCDQCVAVEIASYFCPNCLFDVPSANVRSDKNRCARSCFSCPRCPSALQVTPTETIDPSSSQITTGPPFTLVCPSCKWSSREIGWKFEKNTSVALQVQKMSAATEAVQTEFDAIKDHLDSYLTLSTPQPALGARAPSSARQPTRHISHLTQMAAKALHRDVPGMRSVRKKLEDGKEKAHIAWDEIGEYKAKGSYKVRGVERGMADADEMRDIVQVELATLERRWAIGWDKGGGTRDVLPERIPLITKLTKRCPHSGCRHLLIQPDTKSVRFKIKMVASNYLPTLEVGRRRRRVQSGDMDQAMTPEEVERRRRERRRTRGRAEEEDESLDTVLRPGGVYTFQIAFTNPLYDPIQIRLTQPHPPRNAPPPNHHLHIPVQHFTVAALRDAWAYDEEDEDDEILPSVEGSEGASEESSAFNTLGRRSRKSLLGTGSSRDKKRGETGVEKKGNISKVGIEVEILPDAQGAVEFDLEVRYTYRAEDAVAPKGGEEEGNEGVKGKEEYKTFTFCTRLTVGEVR